MDELDRRVRAMCDLNVAHAREEGGRHEYDGLAQDLSRRGVTSGLARLAAARGNGAAEADPHDEAHLRAFEDRQEVIFGDLGLHRRNPMFLLDELDLSGYDKEYAPARGAGRGARRAPGPWPRVTTRGWRRSTS